MCASHDSTTYIIIYTLYLQSVYKFVTYVCVLSGNKWIELNWIELIDWQLVWLTDRWLRIKWVTASPTNKLTNSDLLIYRLTEWLGDWLIGKMINY